MNSIQQTTGKTYRLEECLLLNSGLIVVLHWISFLGFVSARSLLTPGSLLFPIQADLVLCLFVTILVPGSPSCSSFK